MRTYSSFSKIRGPQYRPQNTIVLIIGTPKRGTPNFGKLPYEDMTGSLGDSTNIFSDLLVEPPKMREVLLHPWYEQLWRFPVGLLGLDLAT